MNKGLKITKKMIEDATDSSNKAQRELVQRADKKEQIEELERIFKNDRTTFAQAIFNTEYWQSWDKVSHLKGFDSSEAMELDSISRSQMKAFLEFVIEKNQEDTLKEIGIYMGKIKKTNE